MGERPIVIRVAGKASWTWWHVVPLAVSNDSRWEATPHQEPVDICANSLQISINTSTLLITSIMIIPQPAKKLRP